MSSDPLQRIQDDLATVKNALGTELPYDRSHVAMYLLSTGLGALLAGLVLLDGEVYVRPALSAYIAMMMAAWVAQIRHLRAGGPARWRWGRKELAASVTAMILLVGYVAWVGTLARWQGKWGLREAFALESAVFFFLGAGGVAWVAADRRRWHILGGAAALVVTGALLPLCENRAHFYLLLGIMIVVGGLSSGLLLWWQIRRYEVGNAD